MFWKFNDAGQFTDPHGILSPKSAFFFLFSSPNLWYNGSAKIQYWICIVIDFNENDKEKRKWLS